jgi:tRNA modification GTPase
MMGSDSRVYNAWRNKMIEVSAYAAAILDYSPDDLPANICDTVRTHAEQLFDEIGNALSQYKTARSIRGGINVVLAGETNVGKSSIFNYLAGSNRAIVSDIAGTTRDVVSINLDLDGYLINLSDTAGLRETDDVIESIGIERTKSEIENADIIIHVYTPDSTIHSNFTNNEIVVINKSDTSDLRTQKNAIYTSVKSGDGMDTLLNTLRNKIHEIMDGAENALTINARTHELLTSARDELAAALRADDNYDIFAEHTRRAADAIGKILGTITASEVLDKTFGQLCLGK